MTQPTAAMYTHPLPARQGSTAYPHYWPQTQQHRYVWRCWHCHNPLAVEDSPQAKVEVPPRCPVCLQFTKFAYLFDQKTGKVFTPHLDRRLLTQVLVGIAIYKANHSGSLLGEANELVEAVVSKPAAPRPPFAVGMGTIT